MKRQHLPMYAIALAIMFVGALALGVPAGNLLFALVLLACPLMMLLMHGGHGGGHGSLHEGDPPATAAGDDNTHQHGTTLR